MKALSPNHWPAREFPLFFVFFFKKIIIFWPRCMACGILVPQPGIKATAPVLAAQSWNHWKSLLLFFFFFLIFIYLTVPVLVVALRIFDQGSSSLTRDRTWAPCIENSRVLATGPPGSPYFWYSCCSGTRLATGEGQQRETIFHKQTSPPPTSSHLTLTCSHPAPGPRALPDLPPGPLPG